MGLYLIAASSFWADPESYWAMFMVAMGLGFVIFVHELGHFLVAKANGVKCEKFYIGFDFFDIKVGGRVVIPRALIKYQYGETEYGIGIIPLGGYVKMLGQDDNPTKYADEMERSKAEEQSATSSEQASGAEADGVDATAGSRLAEAGAETERAKEIEDDPILDPRSYQAKTVGQRMAIISAGVVMNLIFAVVFASIAAPLGVPYTPCEIGGIAPGSPAWIANIQPGDRVMRIGENGETREYIRFRWDFTQAVAANGADKPMEFLIRRTGSDDVEEVVLRPGFIDEEDEFPSIGVVITSTTTLGAENPVIPDSAAARAQPPFQAGDHVVAIDGTAVEDIYQMKRILAQHAADELTFTVQRKQDDSDSTQELEIVVPPNPHRHLGLSMKFGPIVAIQADSPAEAAGLRVGDVLLSINGEPIGDPLTLSDRMGQLARQSDGTPVELTVQRDETTEVLSITPQPSVTTVHYYSRRPIAIDELGIALHVLNVVDAVEPDSPAAQAGLQPGDQVVKAEFIAANAADGEIESEFVRLREIDMAKFPNNWPIVVELMQLVLPDTKVKLSLLRGDQQITKELQPVAAESQFNRTRGFSLKIKQETFTAQTFQEAVAYGFRQTGEDATRVLGFLKKLITGQISPTNLGGPGTIAVVATDEATQGLPRFLLFLTFLSANLAVVNFLPIPVLDGGHMVFLTYELILRRKPSEKWFVGLSIVGLAFILSLMLFVIALDVFRLAPYFTG